MNEVWVILFIVGAIYTIAILLPDDPKKKDRKSSGGFDIPDFDFGDSGGDGGGDGGGD